MPEVMQRTHFESMTEVHLLRRLDVLDVELVSNFHMSISDVKAASNNMRVIRHNEVGPLGLAGVLDSHAQRFVSLVLFKGKNPPDVTEVEEFKFSQLQI